MPPELQGHAVLVSGHHGMVSVEGDRIIMDKSAGSVTSARPLQCIILPENVIVGSDGEVEQAGPPFELGEREEGTTEHKEAVI